MEQTLTADPQTDGKILSKFTKEEVYNATLDYFKGDTLASEVWMNKYCLKDAEANYYELTPNDMHKRLAKEFARIERKYPNPLREEEIFEKIKGFKKIVPQGSPMSGIGNDFQVVSLSNCFVIGNEEEADSYGGIMKLDQELVQLQKRRAGVGLDLSFIRPEGTLVKNSALTSTGIVPFMDRYSNSTREVAQGGRRGALMETIHVKHPDAESFIDAKTVKGKVTGANISVKIDDDFMMAATQGSTYTTQYPIEAVDPKFLKEINASKLWKKIIHNAWKSAEPGILFWDTILKESIPDCYAHLGFKTIATNPCGEITLCANDSCRLLALNLFGYVVNPFTADAYFDWDSFNEDILIAERLMDDIVDLELEKIDKIIDKIKNDPEPDYIKETELNLWLNIKKKAEQGRRTGLGVTGEGDMLAALGYRYGTDVANKFSEEVHKTLKLGAYDSSITMAEERGAFPLFSAELEANNPFIQRIKEEAPELYERMLKYGRRNMALLTIAPTGSVSILTQTTSGIECVFLVYYTRRKKINQNDSAQRVDFVDEQGDQWTEYPVFHHNFERWLDINGYDVQFIKENWTKEQIDELVVESPYYKATSADVDWVKKVEMQGMIQKHVDHSISVTVNLPKDVSEEVVSKVYETGWAVGCKGITVYRDGSRDGVLITDAQKKQNKEMKLFKDIHAPKRPKRLQGDIVRFQNNHEKWVAVVGMLDGRPYEIFTGRLENGLSKLPASVTTCEVVRNKTEEGKTRYDIEYLDPNGDKQIHEGLSHTFNPEFWNYAKMISGVLRHGMPIMYAVDLIQSLTLDDSHLNTWKAGVMRVLKKYIKEGKAKGECPSCGSDSLEYVEGCLTCRSCGNSKCG